MPSLNVYISPSLMAILARAAVSKGTTPEALIASAIESEAVSSLPGGLPGMHFSDRERQRLHDAPPFHRWSDDRPNFGPVDVTFVQGPDGSMIGLE